MIMILNIYIKIINEYIQIFIDKSSGYLNELLEILFVLKKGKYRRDYKINFYKIVVLVIKKLNEMGQNCIVSNKLFCKYHSILYFEQSNFYFEKYFPKTEEENKEDIKIKPEEGAENRKNIGFLNREDLESLIETHKSSLDFLRDINSGAIFLLCKELLKKNELIDGQLLKTSDKGRGITAKSNLLNLDLINRENQKIFLENYEKLLSEIQVSRGFTKKEALCIANIIKINSFISPDFGNNVRYLIYLAERCETIVGHLEDLDKNEKWYLEFEELYEKLKQKKSKDQNYQETLDKMKKKYPEVFQTIDNNFNNMKPIDFIKFIIEKHPYIEREKDKDKKFDNYNPNLLRYLLVKYSPDDYRPIKNKEETVLRYCVIHEISKKLNYLYKTQNN